LSNAIKQYEIELTLRFDTKAELYTRIFQEIRAVPGITVVSVSKPAIKISEEIKKVKIRVKFITTKLMSVPHFLKSVIFRIKQIEGVREVRMVSVPHLTEELCSILLEMPKIISEGRSVGSIVDYFIQSPVHHFRIFDFVKKLEEMLTLFNQTFDVKISSVDIITSIPTLQLLYQGALDAAEVIKSKRQKTTDRKEVDTDAKTAARPTPVTPTQKTKPAKKHVEQDKTVVEPPKFSRGTKVGYKKRRGDVSR